MADLTEEPINTISNGVKMKFFLGRLTGEAVNAAASEGLKALK